ncbi:hypothetical protein ALQ31_200006 [Pseudomonas amygdali pv. morsprunorum]|nr:hypothetical protein ALQ31_200006 [Pseudomonas amygdali pv. morsprunorum]
MSSRRASNSSFSVISSSDDVPVITPPFLITDAFTSVVRAALDAVLSGMRMT